jgi:hypothetical protein
MVRLARPMDRHDNSPSSLRNSFGSDAGTVAELPAVFCWSRIGAEAGQQLDVILRRKEWERQLNNGHFAWGIGNAVVSQMDALVRAERVPKVIFSRIRSAAQRIDSEAARIVLWTAFRYGQQVYELPRDVLVTSRASTPSGADKLRHYALFCKSNGPLAGTSRGFNMEDLENASTASPVGFSQVTAVVKFRGTSGPKANGAYDYCVDAIADLVFPFCAALEGAVELTEHQLGLLNEAGLTSDLQGWTEVVREFRAYASGIVNKGRHTNQSSLF